MKNKYEINYYEVVSCMIKLIGEYDLFNRNHIYGTEGSRVIYLTTNGKCICTSMNSLRHFQMNMITIRCYMDGKSEDEKNFIKKQFPWIPYDNFLEWDDMYGKNIPDNILNYMKLKPSVEVSVNFPYGIPENGGNLFNKSLFSEIGNKILKESKIVRVNIIWNGGVYELNIESHHPLTYSQRRFLLDVIMFHKVDNVYIDDFSKESGVIARQLGIRKEYVKNI